MAKSAVLSKASQVQDSFMACDVCGQTLARGHRGLLAKDAVVLPPGGVSISAADLLHAPSQFGQKFEAVVCLKCKKLVCDKCYKEVGSKCPFCWDQVNL